MHFPSAAARALSPSALIASALLLASCTSVPFLGKNGAEDGEPSGPVPGEHIPSDRVVSNGATITKVKYFHLDTLRPPTTPETSIPFETRYHTHGAITGEEILERYGHYYSVFWEVDDRSAPVTLRFEYRQKFTGPLLKVLEIPIEAPERENLTKFEVTGPPYQLGGPVSAWRVTIVRGDTVLASDQSFQWE